MKAMPIIDSKGVMFGQFQCWLPTKDPNDAACWNLDEKL